MADRSPLRVVAIEPPADTFDAPLVADARRLSALLGVGLRTVRTLDAGGKLPSPVRIGGRVVWRVDEILAWLDADAPDRKTWLAIRAARR